MNTWKRCGHPRTPENTCDVSARKLGGTCRTCHRTRATRHQQTEKRRASNAQYRQTEKYRAVKKRYQQTDKFRVTVARKNWKYQGIDSDFSWADYSRLLLEQGSGCALCGKSPRGRRLDVDHDHADPNGRVRGLLHFACNNNLGQYEAGRQFGPDLAVRIAAYLERSVAV